MYTLSLSGVEAYLFQLCHMAIHKPSPSLEKYLVDMCGKSLRIGLKVCFAARPLFSYGVWVMDNHYRCNYGMSSPQSKELESGTLKVRSGSEHQVSLVGDVMDRTGI